MSERRRAVRLMVSGHIEPRAVTGLISRLDQGYGQGIARRMGEGHITQTPNAPFKRIAPLSGAMSYLAARRSNAAKARTEALHRVKNGEVVTLIILSPNALYHQARFHPDGYWEQRGGLFGKSSRNQMLIKFWRFADRFCAEIQRIAVIRGGSV